MFYFLRWKRASTSKRLRVRARFWNHNSDFRERQQQLATAASSDSRNGRSVVGLFEGPDPGVLLCRGVAGKLVRHPEAAPHPRGQDQQAWAAGKKVKQAENTFSISVLRKFKQYAGFHRSAEFMTIARSIGKDIANTYTKLEKLTLLAKRKTIFDDRYLLRSCTYHLDK